MDVYRTATRVTVLVPSPGHPDRQPPLLAKVAGHFTMAELQKVCVQARLSVADKGVE